MNLDELQSAQSRERQTDSLQPLPESFYADAGAFVRQLREERERAAEEADDPFDSPAVGQLTDDIKTAERTVEAIYERRVGKLVKMASLAAADMPTSEEGLTAEERDLYARLVDAIEENRAGVLSVLDGETGSADTDTGRAEQPAASPGSSAVQDGETTGSDGADAADASAGSAGSDGADGADTARTGPPERREVPSSRSDAVAGDSDAVAGDDDSHGGQSGTGQVDSEPTSPDAKPDGGVGAADGTGAGEGGPADRTAESVPRGSASGQEGRHPDDASDAGAGAEAAGASRSTSTAVDSATAPGGPGGSSEGDVDRLTVRITRDVGEIFGVDERTYTLSSEDVVALPAQNATPLLERDAAERLERQG